MRMGSCQQWEPFWTQMQIVAVHRACPAILPLMDAQLGLCVPSVGHEAPSVELQTPSVAWVLLGYQVQGATDDPAVEGDGIWLLAQTE